MSNKKYRLKADHSVPMEFLCVADKARWPVVYQYCDMPSGNWYIGTTSALGSDTCTIEEVPEVTVEVGDVLKGGLEPIYMLVTSIKEQELTYLCLEDKEHPKFTRPIEWIVRFVQEGAWKKVGKIVYDN